MEFDSDYTVRLQTLGAMGGDTGKTYLSVYDIDLEILRLTEQGGGGGTSYTAGNGISISEEHEISVDTTVIQPKLTAGSNITISNGEISATDTTYTAGTGIQITGTTISCTAVQAVALTQAEYDALVQAGTVDPNTLYIITDAE